MHSITTLPILAKKQRYGKSILLPARIDFIKQSNSQTLRMCFDTRDWDSLLSDGDLGTRSRADECQPGLPARDCKPAHIHSIHVDAGLMDDLQRDGFLFGVKLSFGRRFLFLTRSLELFQSLQTGQRWQSAG
jgi:hypothetical protein